MRRRIVGFSLLFALLPALLCLWSARARILALHEASVEEEVELAARACASRAPGAAATREEWQALLDELASSHPGAWRLESPDKLPLAEAGGTLEPHASHVARAALERDGAILAWLEHAPSAASRARLESELLGALPWTGAAVLCAWAAMAWLWSRRLARPVEDLQRAAEELRRRDWRGAVPVDGPDEVASVALALNQAAAALAARAEAASRERAELGTVLASMAEGVVAVDKQERIVLMNSAAARLLGLEEPLSAGAQLWTRLRFSEMERGLRSVLAGAGPWTGDAATPRADGRMLGLSIAPLADEGESGSAPRGAVVLVSDVTDVRKLEQVRIDFVANVSHELRTPLAAIMGALETIGEPDCDDATQRRFLELANRNAARLSAIVNDLLDLSKIEAEGEGMAVEPLRADLPLRTAAGALAGAAEAKGVVLELPPVLPPGVRLEGNAQRLEQVFTNLLENAIKYTPAGGRVEVRLSIDEREARFEVRDTGIGIPAAALPRVFERFYRVDRSRSRDMGGTGLGLAIVKHVVKAHGGSVSVASEEGRGTTFTVGLPLLSRSGEAGE
ncbi:MAG: Alkaline phosphatase synthesis sensor protein PhoR [Planctomycetota bacterium]